MAQNSKIDLYVLHVFKNRAIDPEQAYLGSTKDIRNRTEFFQENNINYDEIAIDPKDNPDINVKNKLSSMPLNNYDVIIFEHTLWVESIKFLKTTHPEIKVLVRGHNAELYHRWHRLIATLRYKSVFRFFRGVKEIITKFREDYLCAKYSDYVLSISEWESVNYWAKFIAPIKISNTPFFLPHSYLKEIQELKGRKKNRCVQLMSTIPTVLLYDALNNFQKIVAKNSDCLKGWEFEVTGSLKKKWQRKQEYINYVGLLESPLDILSESRAMCTLSNLGYGFKTKILEAIMCGCYVIVPQKLYKRLPDVIKPFCKVVNVKDKNAFINALEETHHPFPDINPNEILKNIAFDNYSAVFNHLFLR